MFYNTYNKEIARELSKSGWELISVRYPSFNESWDSPYRSFFSTNIFSSSTLLAEARKGSRTIELWVRVNKFLFWIISIEYERKEKSKELSREQWERLL